MLLFGYFVWLLCYLGMLCLECTVSCCLVFSDLLLMVNFVVDCLLFVWFCVILKCWVFAFWEMSCLSCACIVLC